jgi:hypothetical protein
MFCNQHHLNYSGNKLWARIFQTSLCQSLVLSLLAIHEFCDECRRHLSSSCCDLNSGRTWTSFFLFSRHAHLVILQQFLPSTSIISDVIASCHFWFVICFSSLKSLSSESRDEILFRGEGCDSSCICNARHIFC